MKFVLIMLLHYFVKDNDMFTCSEAQLEFQLFTVKIEKNEKGKNTMKVILNKFI